MMGGNLKKNKNLEVHDSWKTAGDSQKSCACVFIGHKDALSVPVVPVHDILKYGHSERVQCLVLKVTKFVT